MRTANLYPIVKRYHHASESIVLVTGVFDVLHQHHYHFLEQAKKQAHRLIVGIEADSRVRILKGPNRPIYPQETRRINLENLGIADQIFILPDDFSTPDAHLKLIQAIKPKVLAVSANTNHLEEKNQILNQVGGRVEIVYDHFPDASTTDLLAKAKIIERNQSLLLHMSKPKIHQVGVVSGYGEGKILGFPTLNLIIPSDMEYPLGIFYGQIKVNQDWAMGAFHWGPIPTYLRTGLSLEVFVVDQKINTPPQNVEFKLLVKIRDIIKFENSNQLIQQIQADVELIRSLASKLTD